MSSTQPIGLRKLRANLDKRRIVIIVALVITSLVVMGAVWASKKVTIVADGKNLSVNTFHNDPQDILLQANIALGTKDEYRLSTDKVVDGSVISVYRAVPVKILLKDKMDIVITGKPTVGELAASLGYGPGKGRTVLDGATPVKPMMEVRIVALTEQVTTRKVIMPPPVLRQPDATLEMGLEEVVDEGDEGLKEATVKVRSEDGQEVAAEPLSEKIITQPKPQIVKVGTRETVQTSRGSLRFRQAYWMEATAYLPSDGGGHGITASGLPARNGIVAVDPRVIPLGSRVFVPGYGLALAADTGGMIVGNKIDLCMEDSAAAWHFGRRMVKVYVLE